MRSFFMQKTGGEKMPTVDDLNIKLQAESKAAESSIDSLITKLETLSVKLSGINGNGLKGLAIGVNRLGTAMQTMNGIKTTDFTRLAKNIEKLGNISSGNLYAAAGAMRQMSNAFNSLSGVSQNAQEVGTLASNLSKLGYKSIANAITNLPALASGLSNLMTVLSKAPTVNSNIIDMTNALANLASTGGKIPKITKEISKGFNIFGNSTTKASKKMFSLSSAIGKFYQMFFPVIRIVKKLGKAILSTTDYMETFNFYAVSLQEVGISGEKVGESLRKLSGIELKVFEDGTGQLVNTGMKNLGLNINEVTNYAARLLSVTNSLGLSSQISETAADAFTKLAGDISSLYNIDYSAAATNLQSGLIGQSRALYKYGIDITNATLQTYAYEMGLSKAVSEMTQAEKMQLRMIAILDQSKVAWGDLANTINSPANAIRQFKNNLSELSLVIGQLFIPFLSKVMPFVNGLTMALKSLMTTIAGFFGIRLNLTEAGKSLSGIEEDAVGLEEEITAVGDAAEKTKKQLAGYDELNVISQDSGAGSGAGAVGGGIDLSAQINEATKEYLDEWEKAYKEMENKAQAFAEKITKFLQPIQDMFLHLKLGQFDLAGEDIGDFVLNILDSIKVKLKELPWADIGTSIGEFLVGIPWSDIIWNILTVIGTAIQGLLTSWVNSFIAAPLETSILTGLALLKFTGIGKTLLDVIGRVFNIELGEGQGFGTLLFKLLGKGISWSFGKLGSLIPVLLKGLLVLLSSGLGTALVLAITGALLLATHWDEAMAKLKEIFEGFKKNTAEPLKEDLSRIAKEIFTDFKNFFKGIWDTLSDFGSKIVGWINEKDEAFKKWSNEKIPAVMNKIVGTIKEKFESAKEIVKNAIEFIKGLFDFEFKWPDVPLPHFKITPDGWKVGDLLKGKIPDLDIDWYAKGGVFDGPSVIGVGERGAEAVMPLEHNTGWIDSLADKIAEKMAGAYVGGDTNVVIEGDVAKFFKAVKKENRSYHKQTGKFAY